MDWQTPDEDARAATNPLFNDTKLKLGNVYLSTTEPIAEHEYA